MSSVYTELARDVAKFECDNLVKRNQITNKKAIDVARDNIKCQLGPHEDLIKIGLKLFECYLKNHVDKD